MRPSIGLSIGVLLFCGCQAEKFPIAPASGVVYLNDKPLAGAHVMFQPIPNGTEIEAGPESVGVTDEDGRFTMKTIEPERAGATVGKHNVRVTIQEEENRYGGGGDGGGGNAGPARYTIPLRYRLGIDMVVEVPPEGTDKIELKLTSP
jgi:hypothetical protein